ncbi:hypothetical protein FP2506_15194 [Fulvimarina pelagi HTCC2506]|uniref:LPS-assembly lipoprotein n=1 Tax=Fulvimarina pelagi HTCC2506 TaxID=314231 RepID=Q0G3P1_9HYPH|nr:hypothetical protein [Fulvimarina pelagi]EAU41790.1 hypothetical protein FP2506_15194 [Fulvimarina pelagi HTCC2506]
MWSSDRFKRCGVALAVVAGLSAFSACTARPLYADLSAADGVSASRLASLRGRIAITEANTRTTQIVRNELLSRLNAGARVAEPLYAVRLDATGVERGISIETGGVPRSAIYDLTVTYSLIRLSDDQVIDSGRREIITPYDRTSQLYQAQRALLDAREQAGKEAAAQLEITIATALQQEGY